MKTERVPIASISADPANVRIHPERNLQAITASLRRFGQQKPIVVDGDGIVRAGNGTLAAAIALGWTEIEVVRTPLKGAEATAYAIADNRTGDLAEWDAIALDKQLDALIAEGIPALDLGFADDDISDLLAGVETVPAEGLTDPDAVPEPPATPVTKTGDLILLGEHRLLCGDSTKTDDVERLMDGGVASLMVTDPPYGVAYAGATAVRLIRPNPAFANEDLGDKQGDFWRDAFVAWPLRGDAYICSPSGPPISVLCASIVAAGIEHHQWLIWVKQRFVLGRSHYHYRHEHIF